MFSERISALCGNNQEYIFSQHLGTFIGSGGNKFWKEGSAKFGGTSRDGVIVFSPLFPPRFAQMSFYTFGVVLNPQIYFEYISTGPGFFPNHCL